MKMTEFALSFDVLWGEYGFLWCAHDMHDCFVNVCQILDFFFQLLAHGETASLDDT